MKSLIARALAPCVLCCGLGLAQQPTAPDAAAEVAALVSEHEASPLDYREKYKQWKPRFEAFAAAHRGTEPEVTAQLWLFQQTWWLMEKQEKGEMEKASTAIVDDLLVRHAQSPQLAKIPEYSYVFAAGKKQPVFEALLASPHKSVQASAHLGLAKLAPPKPGWREKGGEVEKAHPHLFALQTKFADEPYLFTTYGAIADAMLNPLTARELALGAAAPEIAGVDQDGKPMRLSDFRGKVVLLDFWGSW